MKFDIHEKNLKVVENKKIWFIVPVAVLVIAIVFGLIYGIVFNGEVFNLGVDFTGGYAITVKTGSVIDENEEINQGVRDTITDVIENKDEEVYDSTSSFGAITGLKVKSITRQGEGAKSSLYVKFTADGYTSQQVVGTSDEDEEDCIVDILSDQILKELKINGYLKDGDAYSMLVETGSTVSSTVSSELLITCICGVIMSLALMLVYIAIRFEMLSGVVALICLVHDMAMMVLFMLVFHIEITSTFVAALITILGYSINNTIIIFDKIRDNLKTYANTATPAMIANDAVRDTFVRSMATTGTTFVTVLMVCLTSIVVGVGDLITFCLPLIAGLVAGTFSSMLLAPTIWAIVRNKLDKKPTVQTLPPKDDIFDANENLNLDEGN